MWGKKYWKSNERLPCGDSDNCFTRNNQVVSESMHATWRSSCEVCVEENIVCKCDNNSHVKELKTVDVVDQTHADKANSSFLHSVINMVGMLIGLGQLSTPYALENGGWASAFLLVGLGIICAYGSHLLGKCLEKNPKARNYIDIGYHAFGNKGRAIATSFIYMEIFFVLVSYTISLHDNLNTVFWGTHLDLDRTNLSTSQLLTILAVLIALPSLWLRDLSSISFLSTGGIIMSLLIFITVPCTAIFGSVKANHSIPFLKFQNIPAVSGLYIFSFAGHIVFPNIYRAMKDPSKFTKVSIVSFSLVTMLYTSMAFTGAKLFGPEVNSQITLSMPRNLIVTKIALWATILTPMTKYALEFAPFAMQLEQNIPHSIIKSSRARMIIRGSVGSFLLLVILALALSVPYFEYVLSLTGSLVSVAICIIFPCMFYVKIFWPQISMTLLILNIVLIAFGFLLGVSGTVSSSSLIIRNLQSAHST